MVGFLFAAIKVCAMGMIATVWHRFALIYNVAAMPPMRTVDFCFIAAAKMILVIIFSETLFGRY